MESYERPELSDEEIKTNAISACVPAVFGVMACVWNVVGGINYAVAAVGVLAVAAAGVVYGWGKEC